ncbi:hypothetical protein N0V83_000924 [Neocucurbitaria cava]|uniref:Uncharacterized protein n=1 Tax=Neocucurbitaria cava TaxID=798079 RepID=A0A9W8YKR5_9PLEO|nr:hypothetical protein N0V83_000924 [Neocucurbitaria cava]
MITKELNIMSFLRPRSMLRSVALRPAALSAAPRARLQVRFATGDYGSPEGNPAGEKAQKQGQNASENLEHPGPPPPKVAEGKSSSSPNSDDKSSGDNSSPKSSSSSSSKGSSSGKREFSTSTRRWAGEEPAVKQGQANKPSKSDQKKAEPKILNENPPAKGEEAEDVKKHNKEMDNRAEQAHEKVANEDAAKDKVPSGFWKG